MSAAPLVAALVLAVLAPPAAAAWRPPVPGPLARPFAVTADPFQAGQHRGIDLRAAPGAAVRAPCTGRVVVAGRVGTNGGVVTLLCGHWRVSHMPLATIAVRAGSPVARGARLGSLARGAGHAGLHIGVRRDGRRFGYIDPLRFLGPPPTAQPPPLGRAPRGRAQPPPAVHPPLAAPKHAPLAASSHGLSGLAPWPAWIGLALALAGVGARRWTVGSAHAIGMRRSARRRAVIADSQLRS